MARDRARYEMAPEESVMVPRMPSKETVAQLLELTSPRATAADRRSAERGFREEQNRLNGITSAALASPGVLPVLVRNNLGVVMEAVHTGAVPATFGPLLLNDFLRSARCREVFSHRMQVLACYCQCGDVPQAGLVAVRDSLLEWRAHTRSRRR